MCPAIIIILKTWPLNISELPGKYGVECAELFFFDSPLMIPVSTVFLFTLLYFLERVYLWNLLCLHGPARCCRIWKPTCRGFTCAQTMRNILSFARPLKVNVSNVQYISILRTPKALRTILSLAFVLLKRLFFNRHWKGLALIAFWRYL